ncbi:MAG: type III-B CRISPR module RAMP protein Cmr6 [Bacillota bacterium]
MDGRMDKGKTLENIGYLFYKRMYIGKQLLDKTTAGSNNSITQNNKEYEKILNTTVSEYEGKFNDIKYQFPVNVDTKARVLEFHLATTSSGLVIGLGYPHGLRDKNDFKLGCYFDYTTGLPMIPGSTVKGILRRPFLEADEKWIGDPELVTCLFPGDKFRNIDNSTSLTVIKSLEMDIFGPRSDSEDKSQYTKNVYERDIFFEASIDFNKTDAKTKIFYDDYITPHDNPLEDPKPLRFLKIGPGIVFRFLFRLSDSKVLYDKGKTFSLTASEKLVLFKKILLDYGVGAKTNVGYGVMEDLNKKATLPSKEQKQ